MMSASFTERMAEFADRPCVAEGDRQATYAELLQRVAVWRRTLQDAGVAPGRVVALLGDYGFQTIAALTALAENGNVIVPLSHDAWPRLGYYCEAAKTEWTLDVRGGEELPRREARTAEHPFYERLRTEGRPGLVLFTSSSTGEPKAAVHDLMRLWARYDRRRTAYRTIVLFQIDHIGGMNTLLFTLANGGLVVVPRDRLPRSVCEAIERYRVELLPSSPTFLNLLLLSGEADVRDLSSLRRITYGAEPMPAHTLARVRQAFPHVELQQTYGLTEVGILHSQSRDPHSLWMRVGGAGYETKIVQGRLWIRAASSMLGYLNAPSPYDEEGYFDTGDVVEQDGEWLRILGRASEMINVGGSKVFPADVENVLLQMDGVGDALVYGEPHVLTGRVVAARVRLTTQETLTDFKTRMRLFCQTRLPSYAVPAKVTLTDQDLHTGRYKKRRSQPASVS